MKLIDTENLTCPFSTTNRELPVYCGGDNCMAWQEDDTTEAGGYMNVKEIKHGHCKLIDKDME